MRKQLFLGVVAALGLCSSSAWATKTNYTAELSGPEAATGTASFTFDSDTRILCGSVTITGTLTTAATAVLIEPNDDFEPADDIANVTPATKPQTGTFGFKTTIAADKTGALTSEASFINFLTTAHPDRDDGELNGGIGLADEGTAETPCPGVVDAGTDAGKTTTPPVTTTSSSSSSSSSSGDDTSGSSSTVDAGKASSSDSGGCSTVGDSNAASGLGLVTIASMGLALILRGRRRRR